MNNNIAFSPGESHEERSKKLLRLFELFEKGHVATLLVGSDKKAENIGRIADTLPHLKDIGFDKETVEFRFAT